ncbi:hypothetical protein CGRA01v4_12917 [Colletotrichum graminicola]|uniref:Uncharacterized protein n=1 Tax=Colletotrichum graminicola (strain M1.001 / M2 / FGSC 10212) TaxID=645133 RepID=E3QJ11_COLGM|nr:uncharacterized protein GLRG_05993 [Colletotrichum graminicola M1.001]EFQ30849.1 hypothetical protein GLRG_05993 [Colletotrichum graminicola M1.001]WDK21627.1 hypothetical protein CGRA01v4_12917 [Colletotrichum graminicola]
MSSTALSASSAPPAAPSSTAPVCTSNLYDTPSQDRVCAMPLAGNHTAIMSACCRDADVVSYYDGCGIYCLALGQSIRDLQDCLFDQGAGYTAVFCRDNGDVNASATATGNVPPPASAQASVVASGGAGDDGGSASDTSSGSGRGASSTSSPNAAAPAGLHAPGGLSTLGLTIGALLLSAATVGALQI